MINSKLSDVSVVIPVYNSENIIIELVKRIKEAILNCAENHEIILIDDCSSDSSWQIIQGICKIDKNVKAVRLGKNLGQFKATTIGVSLSKGQYIVTIDDDLEYNPMDIQLLINKMTEEDYYLVIGLSNNKYKSKGLNTPISKLRNNLLNLIWNKPVTDSFRLMKRNVFFANDQIKSYLKIDAFIKHYLDVKFIGYQSVSINKRFSGNSNHNTFKKIQLFFKFSEQYIHLPFLVMLLLILILLTLALLFIVVFKNVYLYTFLKWSTIISMLVVIIISQLFISARISLLIENPSNSIIETINFKEVI